MARKLLGLLRGVVADGAVRLTCYKTTPAFNKDPKVQEQFRTIRVYRRLEEAFEFGGDYAEYFDGLSWRDAELVFDGALPAGNGRKFTYLDRDVAAGCTYAYWMAAADGEPTGPAAVKVRDPQVWWPCAEVERRMAALAEAFPEQVAVEMIGQSVRGRDIEAIRVGNAARRIGLVGALHAGEAGAELMLPVFEQLLTHHGELLNDVAIVAVPVANPDERERLVEGVPWYLRTNANGVDMNRNFPAGWDTVEHGYGLVSSEPGSATYRGPHAASEPETRAVMAFLREQAPQVVYSFHCLASVCGMSFLGPKCGQDDTAYAGRCRDLATAYCLGMEPTFPEDKVLSFGTTSGSLPAWCCAELGIPAFDIEMSGIEEKALAQCRVDATDMALLEEYRKRHLGGVQAVLRKLAG